MLGQMMHMSLTIQSLIDHAALYHSDTEIVSVNTGGDVELTSWGEVGANARRLGDALTQLGLDPQARCGTIAWNNRRHLEIYFGVSGAGFVCHTLNPRLHPEQLAYIINHAADTVLFIDRTFVPLVAAVRDSIPTVKHIILMDAVDAETAAKLPGIMGYDDFLASGSDMFEWPEFDENTASSLCYTSGTTGNPKGVLYSHRSTVLHSLVAAHPDGLGLSALKRVLPVVPMFHVNAWGTPYACAAVGASMVLPGPGLDGASLVKLIDTYEVHQALGVPTIWLGLLTEAERAGSMLESLEKTVVGGSACPPSIIDKFRDTYGVETIHAWGMTEMSPLGTGNQLKPKHLKLPEAEQRALRENQGRPPWGVGLKIVDDAGQELPRDGAAQGDLLVKGPWIIDSYLGKTTEETLTDGWFHTGDVATLDADGFLTIKDRSKDIIKSGGEWISSVDLENIAVGHPDLANAAVIGARHAKWDERPIVIAVPATGATPSEADVLAIFEGKVAKWQVPDKVIFVEALPLGATGKVLKRELKSQYGDVLI